MASRVSQRRRRGGGSATGVLLLLLLLLHVLLLLLLVVVVMLMHLMLMHLMLMHSNVRVTNREGTSGGETWSSDGESRTMGVKVLLLLLLLLLLIVMMLLLLHKNWCLRHECHGRKWSMQRALAAALLRRSPHDFLSGGHLQARESQRENVTV
jgi:hypothetical protein